MLKYFINIISKTLAFSKNEAIGTFVLVVLVFVGFSAANFATYLIRSDQELPYDSLALKQWVAEVEASVSEKEKEARPVYFKSTRPSTLTSHFAKPKNEVKKGLKQPVESEKPIIKDLNSASPEDLQKIKGIGKVYSDRIIKYRNLLGGFSHIDQLGEVYGLNQEVIQKIQEGFAILSGVDALAINSDSVKILARHPYISYDLAWVIINYRKQNGDIADFEDFQKIKALDDSLLLKLRPYIK